MGKFRFKRKTYSKYDETDNLKRMNDADILAEEKKKKPGYGNVLTKAATGAAIGALAGGALGLRKGGTVTRGMKTGAVLGGIAMGLGAVNKRDKEVDNVNFYNKRLDYAQRQAKRRESKDWKANMTQREGYSY